MEDSGLGDERVFSSGSLLQEVCQHSGTCSWIYKQVSELMVIKAWIWSAFYNAS